MSVVAVNSLSQQGPSVVETVRTADICEQSVTAQTQLTCTDLSHSENYTVSVVAVNSLGQQGPSAVGTVRTRDIRE